MLHFDEIVFGPVHSRRLGSSLGMNILPAGGKVCNFDCIYCECGWNRDWSAGGKFPGAEDVRLALEAKLSEAAAGGMSIDSITFSGNGEPTLNPDFPQIIDVTLELRDRYFPEAKISVLSNATMLGKEDVVNALMKTDNPILKLDASDDGLVRMINRPSGRYGTDDVIRCLEKFRGAFILQTMFLKSPDFDTAAPGPLEKWRDIVRLLKPRTVMVYTIDRETPDKSLSKCTVGEMTDYVRPLIEEGFDVQISG